MKETYCLLVDLIGSTSASKSRTNEGNEDFYRALLKHLGEYIRVAALGEVLIDFVGDGWLVRTKDVNQLPTLCCVAIVFCKQFATQMSQIFHKRKEKEAIPPLRITLCCGLDSEVLLPTGMSGFIGDSARLATRAAKFCESNEIVVDSVVRQFTERDFDYSPDDIVGARRSKVDEQTRSQAPRQLFVLKGLSPSMEKSHRLAKLRDDLSKIEYLSPPALPPKGPQLPKGWDQVECDVAFDVVFGQLISEPSKPSSFEVTAKPTKRVFTPPLALADLSWSAIFWAFDDAASTQRQLYFKRLGRVESWHDVNGRLELTLNLTFYAHFIATNLNLQLPRDGKPHAIQQRINELVGVDRTMRQDFLASPLNVLAGVVSKDGFLFVPRRNHHLTERPGVLQTSVGGFWEWCDEGKPFLTLRREAEEELGLVIKPEEVEFVAFGFNGQTGEPDLLAIVNSQRTRKEIYDGWRRATKSDPSSAEVSLDTKLGALELNVKKADENELVNFIRKWRRADDWSQPSDRAAILATLSRYVQRDRLKQALMQSLHTG